jgi:hypothetical protein
MDSTEEGKKYIGYIMMEEKENDIIKVGEQLMDGLEKPKTADILTQVDDKLKEVDITFNMKVVEDIGRKFCKITRKGEFYDEDEDSHTTGSH